MLTIIVRSVLLVAFAVLAVRLMGKRQVGQLQPFELVIAIMIADLAATPMESLDVPRWRGVVPMLALVILHQLFTLLSLKSQRARAFFSGTPTLVIHRGAVRYDALKKLAFNLNDLMEELRNCGVQNPDDVEEAIMETGGRLSVFLKSAKRPLCPEDMGVATAFEGVPLTLIMDGKLEPGNLALLRKDEEWLHERLAELGLQSVKEALLCYATTDGALCAYGYGGDAPRKRQALDKEEICW